MRIRWKLMISLLTIALVPLLAVSLLGHHGLLQLGHDLAAQSRNAIIERTGQQLLELVKTHANVLRRSSDIVELAVSMQARAAERCLANQPPAEPLAYFAHDFDQRPAEISGMKSSPKHFRFAEKQAPAPILVTYDHQVFRCSPGIKPPDVAPDVARLVPLASTYRHLYDAHPDLIYWQYTSLENGLHSAYPGHGGYPSNYDPRQRDWYKTAKSQRSRLWTRPYVEVSTQQVIITAAMPVHRPDGSFAGVTSIDVPIAEMIAELIPPDRPDTEARTFLVAMVSHADDPNQITEWQNQSKNGKPGLLILAQQDHRNRSQDWSKPFDPEWLESDDPEQTSQLIRNMLENKAGVQRLPLDKRPSIWAHALTHDRGGYLVRVVPYDEMIAEAQAAEDYVLTRTWHHIRIMGGVFLAVILLVILIAVIGSRTVTEPLRQLTRAADRIAQGRFDTRVQIHTRDELEELGRTFNTMVTQLQERMRIKQSLAVAMEVQQHLLPASPPQIEGLDVAGKVIYCDETGGDYYDFLDLSELAPHYLRVAIGDVTGHGIAAALLMATARAILRSRVMQPGNLAELMNHMNKRLTADTPIGRFMTLFYIVINAHNRQAHWISAGHDPAITYTPDQDLFGELPGSDIPLGIDAAWNYNERGPETLAQGQILVLGTDGIWEARNPQGRMFGKDRLRDVIRQNANQSADHISHAITDALAGFRETHPQEDDVTLVVIKTLPQ